ncbi:MAG: hypothetical protein Q9225_003918 [Loekoesia sp. 1 TL-2023]
MDNDSQQLLKTVEQAESKLCAVLEDTDSTDLKFGLLIQEYRSACQALILEDFRFARSKNIEGKLWDTHVRMNGRFRKRLGYFRTPKGKRKPVEQRKAAKSYLDFIKLSQRFYRGYIQGLALRFSGIPEIEAIAYRFSSDSITSEKKIQTSSDLQGAVLQSCHRTLIHLGDLSRYRETEIDDKKKEKNWGPALGYYDLAVAIYPPSGIPYNQLAIISKSEDDHSRALYYLYRAQSAFEPPPTAFANLELEFKKIREASERGDLTFGANEQSINPFLRLQHCFPLLHSRCFDGIDLGDYERLESEVLKQLAIGLEERSLEANFVNRMVLSNIAADYVAGDRWQEVPDTIQNEVAFKLFQRLNVRTFYTLLQLLQAEYKRRATTSSTDSVGSITPVTRRLLPGLRYYQFWLLSRAALLSAHLGEPKMELPIQHFWTTYVEVLALMLSTTRFEDLPQLDYLFEEDEEIIGFRPLQEADIQQKYFIQNSSSKKPKCHEQGVKRHHPNSEMLCRVRDFVADAVELANNEFVPIKLAQDAGRFVLQENLLGIAQTQTSLGKGIHSLPTEAQRADITQPEGTSFPDAESTTDDAVSQGASVPLSLSTTMNQMVDNLVGPDPSNNTVPPPSTPPAPTLASAQGDGANETSYGVVNSTLTALDFVNQVRSWSPKVQPSEAPNPTLPSIMNSPFAPRPEEKPVLARSPATRRMTPTHSPHQSQQQFPKHSLDSTVSSMSDPTLPSSMAPEPPLYPSLMNKVFGTRQHYGALMDDLNFDSSNVVTGSSFPYNARNHATQPTPPNGQG